MNLLPVFYDSLHQNEPSALIHSHVSAANTTTQFFHLNPHQVWLKFVLMGAAWHDLIHPTEVLTHQWGSIVV